MKEITLADFLNQYPHVSLAAEGDNQDILDFYHQTSLSSAESEIIYTRGNDFFAFLKERGPSSLILLLKDEARAIQGMGVISYRPGFIDGKLQTVGYLGDLRVKLNRKLIREWRLMYANLMKLSHQMKETHYCRYYQTVLIDENKESKNNLAETRIANLAYNKLQNYKMINVIGRVKLRAMATYVRFASSADEKLIVNFLNANNKKGHFAHDWNAEFSHRLKNWANFTISDYLLAFDKQGELLAITSLWNPIATKQIRITKIQTALKALHAIGSKIPFFEFKKLPQENSPIEILYLNQINFKSGLSRVSAKDITLDFLHFAFQKPFHMLAYADFEGENYLENVSSLFMQKMPMGIYSVHYKDDKEVQFPLSHNEGAATTTFDMPLV